MEVMRWVLVGVVGVLTGIVAFLVSIADKYLVNDKLEKFDESNSPHMCIPSSPHMYMYNILTLQFMMLHTKTEQSFLVF